LRTFLNQRFKANYPQVANKSRQGRACGPPLRATLANERTLRV
jgi:hypothetical protein